MVGGLRNRGPEVIRRKNAWRHSGIRATLMAACGLCVVVAAVAAQSPGEKPKRGLFSIFGRSAQAPSADSERSSKNRFMQTARQKLAEARQLANEGQLEKAIESARRAEKLATISARYTPARWNRDEQSPSEYLQVLEAEYVERHGKFPQTKIQLASSQAARIGSGAARIQHADADFKILPDNAGGTSENATTTRAQPPAIWKLDEFEDATNPVPNKLTDSENVPAYQDDVGRQSNAFVLDSRNSDSRRSNPPAVALIAEDPLSDGFSWKATPPSKQQSNGFRLDLTDRKTALDEFVPVETPIRTATVDASELSNPVHRIPEAISADRRQLEFDRSAPGNNPNAAAEFPSNAIRISDSTRGESPLLPETFDWQRDVGPAATGPVVANAASAAVSVPKARSPVPWPEQFVLGHQQAVAAVSHSESSNTPGLWTSAIVHLASTLAALLLVVLLFAVIRTFFLYRYGTDIALVFRIERVAAYASGNGVDGLQKSEYRAGNDDSAANPFSSSDSPFPLSVIASEYDDRRREEEQQKLEQEQAMMKQVFELNLKLREQIAEMDNDDTEATAD